MSDTPATVCAAFQRTKSIDPDAIAFRSPADEVSVSWREYDERVRALAAGFAALGVQRGDTVAFMMRNRPEFALVDAGAMHAGAACVSAYNTSSPEQLAYVLRHSGARIMVCESTMLERVVASGVELEHVICIDGPGEGATLTLKELEAIGDPAYDFDAGWQAVQPDDVCTLIYTSGTTGDPKGVRITHTNILTQVRGADEILGSRFGDRITSFMPAAHIADRVSTLYWMAILGFQVTYVADPKTILAALNDCRPTIWFAVPRIWEKFRAAIEAKVAAEADPDRKALVQRAIELGHQHARSQRAGAALPAELEAEWHQLDQTVLASLRNTLGLDQARLSLCGSAPVAAETLEFFLALGITVVEVWGMSETTGIGTVNPPGDNRIGSVGKALPGCEAALAEDGELLFRGPVVTPGYRDNPAQTAEAIDTDGWLHTGDIAVIDDDGYVTIVDRKKEIIINAAGKNMSPANIENAIKGACPLIGSLALIGDARAYNVALIALDADAAAAFAAKSGLSDVSAPALSAHPDVRAIVAAGVEAGNATLSQVEQVKKYVILPTYWEPGGDELTPTMKLRRKPINTKYAAEIESLYAG